MIVIAASLISSNETAGVFDLSGTLLTKRDLFLVIALFSYFFFLLLLFTSLPLVIARDRLTRGHESIRSSLVGSAAEKERTTSISSQGEIDTGEWIVDCAVAIIRGQKRAFVVE